MDLDADIDVMLEFDSEVLTFGALTGKCQLNVTDQDMIQGITSAIGEVRIGLIRTSAFPDIAVGSSVTLGGTPYEIRDRKRVGDGRITLIALGAP
jgi:hypothetical protein